MAAPKEQREARYSARKPALHLRASRSVAASLSAFADAEGSRAPLDCEENLRQRDGASAANVSVVDRACFLWSVCLLIVLTRRGSGSRSTASSEADWKGPHSRCGRELEPLAFFDESSGACEAAQRGRYEGVCS
jgi:hypothetical protein